MPKRSQKSSAAIVWYAEQLRTTIFPTESPLALNLLDLWKQLRGDEPDKFSLEPSLQRIEKELDGRNFIITLSVDRIHFQMMPPTPAAPPEWSFKENTEFLKMLPIFEEVVVPWLGNDKVNNIIRLAVGGVLLSPVKSRNEGYKRLDTLLPAVHIDVENSRNFQYQINRPRDIKVDEEDSYCNRMSTWSVFKSQPVGLIVGLEGAMHKETLPTKHACRLALDISTPQDNKVIFKSEMIIPLSHELHKLGIEIADHGDIA